MSYECGGADVDERRAIKILSALFFPSDPEGKRGDRDCVWHEKRRKNPPQSISSQSEKPILKAD